jgi:hypothetical protein
MNTHSYPTDHELNRVLTLSEAAHLCSLSIDTLRRRYKDKILRLSPRRSGIRVRDVLAIGTPGRAA